jgi:photosynthetic reaction center cytochrome c subunit
MMRQSHLALASALLLSGCQFFDKKDNVQLGYRGTAMEQTIDHGDRVASVAEIRLPTPVPPAGASPPGPLPWRNVQVLNDISVAEFNRTMVAFSTWVAGTGNCAYCHDIRNLASDTLQNGSPIYTKLVARRMIQMTRTINGSWSQHVANTGVTCYTCHRGKPLPPGLWFYNGHATQIQRHYLDRDGARVVSHEEAPSNANRSSVKQTEWTYSLMISMSQALNVNCTYCHNSRQFASWEQAPKARVTAYHGIYMLRDLNMKYLAPLQTVFPAARLGPQGDAPKAQCVTCHQGAYKPLYAAQMAKDYPAIWGRGEWNGTPFPPMSSPIASTDSASSVTGAVSAPADSATVARPTASARPPGKPGRVAGSGL